MSVEVEPTVEVVLEAGDRVVAKHDVVFSVFNFEIVADLREALQQAGVVASVVITLDEDDIAVESLQYVDGGRHITPEHITEDIDSVAGIDGSVPTANEFFIVFAGGFEGAIIEEENVSVVVVPISDI